MTSNNKTYKIKEIFYSIQGEGYHSGRPAIFIRFSGCNLWTGQEKDRDKAICQFCDTDFVGTDGTNGGIYTSEELVVKLLDLSKDSNCRFAIFTGGEPLLQADSALINKLKSEGFYISVETNGTQKVPKGINWITVSPKANAKFIQKFGDELKLIYPQENSDPSSFIDLKFNHFYLQPKDETKPNNNLLQTLNYCLKNPKWKISLQIHKILDIR